MHHGEAGYINSCRKIMTSAQSILHALRTSPVLRDDLIVFGNPKASVVAWTSKSLPIMCVFLAMPRASAVDQVVGVSAG